MTLAELRAHLAALKSRAAAKIAEVADGMAAEAVRAIETDHADLVRQVRETETKIEAAEAAERGAPAPSATAIAAERARAAEINTLAARHSMPAEFVARHIADGTSLDQVRGLVLDAVAERAAGTTANPRVQVITDEGDTVRDAIEVAIMHRANPRLVELTDAARAWRGMSLMEMGRTFVEDTQGVKLRGLGRMELAGALLGMPTNLRSGGPLTTSDFPNLLANVISKRLRSAYEVAPQNWKKLSRQNNAPDFKARAIVQLSNMPNLKPVKEGGEFTRMALADSKESYSLSTFGRVITLSRQSLINDDLSAFDRIPMLFGRAAAETEAALFWAIVTSNPNMGDGVALFHANHGNLAASGSAIAIASLSAGRKAMRKQKGLAAKASDAEPLNLAPAFIVVSPDKETEAQQFLATTLYPQQNAQVNPFAGSLLQITEARLTGNAWYLFADPATIDTIEYAYLDGEEGLYTESRLGFDVDGVEVKGRLDFAAKAIDWRGMYQDPGA
jgi:phage major head subunit gpT-like protein